MNDMALKIRRALNRALDWDPEVSPKHSSVWVWEWAGFYVAVRYWAEGKEWEDSMFVGPDGIDLILTLLGVEGVVDALVLVPESAAGEFLRALE